MDCSDTRFIAVSTTEQKSCCHCAFRVADLSGDPYHLLRQYSMSSDTIVVSGRLLGLRPGYRAIWELIALFMFVAFLASASLAVSPNELLLHPPTHYFNDYAQAVQPATASSLNNALANFERETSNQIVVVIFPEWPPDVVFDDYAQNLFRAAKFGQQGKDNGVLVLLSLKEGRIRIHTGRGLEVALPNALCLRIITEEFAPQFRVGNFDESFRKGLAAIMAATRDEYKGDGKTAAEKKGT